MPYPQEMLSSGEEIVYEFGSHWSTLWQEALVTVAYVWLLVLLWPLNGWVFTILTLVWLAIAVRGFFEWKTVQHVITTERLIVRSGLLRKIGYEFPLEAINDVAFRQNIVERGLGVGDLMIETASSKGQSRMANIPHPEKVKNVISETRRKRTESVARGGVAARPSTTTTSSAEQLAILGKLLDEGKLTPEEYETQKQKLLG